MTTLLAFAFVLGVLIFVHELGHFVMARRVGIRVLKFSLGFGPRLVGFKRGRHGICHQRDPAWRLREDGGRKPRRSALRTGRRVPVENEMATVPGPHHGTVDEPDSRGRGDRGRSDERRGDPRVSIQAASRWPGRCPDRRPREPAFNRAIASSASRGAKSNTWEQFFFAVGTRAGREIDVVVLRNGKEISVAVTPTPETRFEVGDIGVLPDSHPHVGSILPGSPAEKAGLKTGDVILKVDGAPISVPGQLIDAVSKKANTPVTITIARGGVEQDVQVTPELNAGRGRIGINIAEDVMRIKPGPIDAIGMSIKRNYESAGLIFMTIGQLITRETSTRQLMGPLAIAQLSGESAQQGWVPLFALMASISLNLGLLNLLPIPVLDGGHIFIMALEGLARRDFSLRVKEKMFLAGFAVLLMLMVTVIYNDLTRIPIVERLMPWRQ